MTEYAFYRWVPCPECAGSARVMVELKGANILATGRCHSCIFGTARQRMTREQVLDALGTVPTTSEGKP